MNARIRLLFPSVLMLCLASSPALATVAQTATSPSPATATVPAPDSPQAIEELHALLSEAYQRGEAAAQQTTPQATQRPVLAAWVEVLRNAIDTFTSACFVAAWGFALGMVMLGMGVLIAALRRSRKSS